MSSTNIAQLFANIPGLKQDFKMDWKDNTKADWSTVEVVVTPEPDVAEPEVDTPVPPAPEGDSEADATET